MILAFSRGKGLWSAIIRWQTWSKYSHVAAVTPDAVYDAMPFKGVRKRKFWSDISDIDFFVVTGAYRNLTAVNFIEDQIGKGYDWFGVLRFIPRWRKSNNRWFCSELIYEAMRRAGLTMLRDIPASKVSPGLLSQSPYLTQISGETLKKKLV